ncbi:MAG: hypothetical protein WBE28_08725 [bacterium]
MLRIIVFACILFTSLVSIVSLTGCGRAEYKDVALDLYSLILPGATDTEHEVIAKFSWQGGGYLQQISEVKVDYFNNSITIQPFGLQRLRGVYTFEFFTRIDKVSLGILPGGIYTVVLIGKNFVYYDTLHVPTEVPDTAFQFHITAIDLATHDPVPDIPVHLWIDDTALTHLTDTTDMSSTATIRYENNTVDTIAYDLFTGPSGWSGYYGNTQAIKGIPEVITLGVGE